MFPSLSDRTKSFLAVAAVLAVAVCNVVFGMDWVAERPAARPLAAVTGVSRAADGREPPPAGARRPRGSRSPPMNGNAAAAPKNGASQPDAAQ